MYTIIIPTLQKRLDILKKLIENLENDSSVGEIIVINNALKPLDFEFSKLRVITKDKNLYVNPSWNLGVSEAKYDIIGLLNDDIILAPDFCTSLKNKLPENFGVIGFGKNEVNIINDLSEPQQSEINLKETDFIELGFGISMFFKKENYQNIPNELKIMYGDCFIFDSFKNRGFKNYKIQGQKIHHLGSLTT
ncbi:glycosyltransferase, partial [bacterium]|nr:glycosyltransferase [bacterium]